MTTARPDAAADERYLRLAISLAVDNVRDGGGPFGAVIVTSGEVVATGQNRVTRDNDPSAHAEVTAIRAAGRALGSYSLAGTTLYTSCEPCPMCMATSMWARVDRVVFAADRDDAAAGGFDDRAFYDLFARDRDTWDLTVERLGVQESFDPFAAWLRNLDRTHY